MEKILAILYGFCAIMVLLSLRFSENLAVCTGGSAGDEVGVLFMAAMLVVGGALAFCAATNDE